MRRVEDILHDESFKNKKCDKIKLKLGINRDKFLDEPFELLFFSLHSKNKISGVHLCELKLCFILG